jgi:hypothetical protein
MRVSLASYVKTNMNLLTASPRTHQPHPKRTIGVSRDTDDHLSSRDGTRPTVTCYHDPCPSRPYRRYDPTDPSTSMTTGHLSTTGSPTKDATHAHHWLQADAEEMERLFTSGTIQPIYYSEIPNQNVVTYVNPICSEKLNDDETLKLRTRITIGSDRIDYPCHKSAVTANMEALKLLINAMISEDANWSTIDSSDFYLGTPLPHPEYIRIQKALIPDEVLKFYDLIRFLHHGALYYSVHKTHYGLPQAGALSQKRMFKHLAEHGYRQLPNTPSFFFRNESGTIRFGLVVDDFAVVWTMKEDFQHRTR